MYQALYRKWRPKTFDDVVGQEHISETLKRQIGSGRLSHAYLFVGTRGTGKTTCAKILSRAINCTNPHDGNPCNKCNSCLGIENGSIMDVLELDAASNNGVDNVRALREEAVFTPVDVKKRVYIIDEVHMLSTPAFNALLKILEEPPEHLIFILATTEIHKVPATILSRCQRFTFKRILPSMIAGRLHYIAQQEGITLTDDAASLLARLSDGSLRDALSLLDQSASDDIVDYDRVLSAIGLAGSSEIASILSAVADNDTVGALNLLDKFYIGGKVMASVLEELENLVRDVLLTLLMPKGGTGLLSGSFDQNVLEGFAKRFSAEQLLSVMDTLRETAQELSKSSGGKLNVELCLMRLCDKRLNSGITSMLTRISRLEEQLESGAIHTQTSNPSSGYSERPMIRENNPTVKAAPEERPASAAPMPEIEPAVYEPAVQVTAAEAASVYTQKPTDAQHETSEKPRLKELDGAGEIWGGIIALIKSVVDEPHLSILSEQITAAIDGNALVLSAKTVFGVNILNKSLIAAAIRDAIPRVTNKNLTVRVVQENGNTGDNSDKLDALSRFSNIKFE